MTFVTLLYDNSAGVLCNNRSMIIVYSKTPDDMQLASLLPISLKDAIKSVTSGDCHVLYVDNFCLLLEPRKPFKRFVRRNGDDGPYQFEGRAKELRE